MSLPKALLFLLLLSIPVPGEIFSSNVGEKVDKNVRAEGRLPYLKA